MDSTKNEVLYMNMKYCMVLHIEQFQKLKVTSAFALNLALPVNLVVMLVTAIFRQYHYSMLFF